MNTLGLTRQTAARARIHEAALRLFAENGGAAVSVSELAQAAGIARGTIYNNIPSPEALFSDVAASLAQDMIARTEATMDGIDDPVHRLATGVRIFVRRAHEERDWGRFMVRFALGEATLQGMMHEPPARDIARAIESGRFKADASQTRALVSMLSGATLAAMQGVINGEQTWREAGAHTAEFFLRAGGIPAAEARRIVAVDLQPLAPAPQHNSGKHP
jgi:AcrR family transcriptional regulator